MPLPTEYLIVPPRLFVPEWLCSQGSGHTIAAQLERTPWCPRCGAWYHRTGEVKVPNEKYPTERHIEFMVSCFCYRRANVGAP